MRILFGTDGSRYARAAAHFLARWVNAEGGRVDLVTVVPKRPASQGPFKGDRLGSWERWRGRAARWQDAVEEPLLVRGYRVTRMVRTGDPADVLVALSRRGQYDLVVVGAKGRDDGSYFGLGSSALALLDRAPQPVLVVRERDFGYRTRRFIPSRHGPLPVLLGSDGPPPSRHAVRAFCSLFRSAPVDAELLAVLEGPEGAPGRILSPSERARLQRDSESAIRRRLAPTENELRGRQVASATRILEGHPATGLVSRAGASETEMIVVECRRPSRAPEAGFETGGMPRALLGEDALEIVRSAPCSVLRLRDLEHQASMEPWYHLVNRSPLG